MKIWEKPTRRTFVAMLAAAAAALAVKLPDKPDTSTSAKLPRWIGHA
jgi:hypothetical protein